MKHEFNFEGLAVLKMGKDIFTGKSTSDKKVALIRMPDGMQMTYSKYSLGVILSHPESYRGYDMAVFQRALRAYEEAEAENLNFGPPQYRTCKDSKFTPHIHPHMVLQA